MGDGGPVGFTAQRVCIHDRIGIEGPNNPVLPVEGVAVQIFARDGRTRPFGDSNTDDGMRLV
jgi:hypothetical protein